VRAKQEYPPQQRSSYRSCLFRGYTVPDHRPRPPVWRRLQRGIEKKHAHRNDAVRTQTLVDDNEKQSKAGFENLRI